MDLAQKVTQIEDKVDEVSNQVKSVHEKMSGVDVRFNEMYTAIVGNKSLGQKGFVGRLEELEETKLKWQRKVDWMYGYMVGIGALCTLVIEVLKNKLK